MSAHTPGPWYVSDNQGYATEYSRWSINSDDWTVAVVITDTDELAGSGEANAALLSAAPELLRACKKAEAYLAKRLENPPRWHEGIGKVLPMLRDAIEKATKP